MKHLKLTRRLRAALHKIARDRRGNVSIELAFAAPAVFMMVFGIMEAGRAMWLKTALDYSVAEAARCASINPTLCGTASQIQDYATTQAAAGFTSSVFSFNQPSCGNQVSASYPMSLTIPYAPVSFTLTAQACYPS